MNKYPYLLSPMKVGKITFKNRLFGAPNILLKTDENGNAIGDYAGYIEAKAAGGLASVTIGDVPCDLNPYLSLPDKELVNTRAFKILQDLADRVNRHNAVSSVELISPGINFAARMLGAYGFRMGPCGFKDEQGEVLEMNAELRRRVIDDYARAVEIYKMAGFGMVMLMGGHFWLLNQWLSPIWNHRTDEYGGPIQNRARFPIEIIDGIRKKVGYDILIEYRLSGSDLYEGGNEVEDVIEFVKMVRGKVDIIHVSSGSVQVPDKLQTGITLFGPYGNNVYLAAAIKKACPDVPVSVVGNMINPEHMESVIAEGKADFASMARATLADPDIANKLAEGRREEIIPCLRCFHCMNDLREQTGRDVNFECAVNPYPYKNLDITPVKNPRKVLVAGGGPAGINAAFTAAMKGHDVTLVEKTDKLGGILKFSDTDTVKPDMKSYVKYLVKMLEKYQVNIILNTEVTPEYVQKAKPDVVFVANGSVPIVPKIPGIEKACHAIAIFDNPTLLKGTSTVMIGGGLAGCETAAYLADLGQTVTIVEMAKKVGMESFYQCYGGLLQGLADRNIRIMTGTTCTEIGARGVKVISKDGSAQIIAADNIVYAVGMRAVTGLYDKLKGLAPYVIPIGDCKKAGKISNAVYDAVYGVLSLK